MKIPSLTAELEKQKDTNPDVYAAIQHFRTVCVPKLKARFPSFAMVALMRHWDATYKGEKYLFGYYPDGKLICAEVKEIKKRRGPNAEEAARNLRRIVKDDIGTLRSVEQAERVAEALKLLFSVI